MVALEEFPKGARASEVWELIESKNLYTPSNGGKTPDATVQAQLGEFIRKNDDRVRRVKTDKVFVYFLSKYSAGANDVLENKGNNHKTPKYKERDLHPLLCTYLRHNDVLAKTILHECSKGSDEHQKWVHPDMVGVKFAKFENKVVSGLYKELNGERTAELYSYELKREIKTDHDLKKCYFQAVSNSTWANYGYLVAFEIGDNLREEIERLNAAFGIGVIELKANPYSSRVLYAAKRNEVEFRTLDKLCKINKNLEELIDKVNSMLTVQERYQEAMRKELVDFCDVPFKSDDEISEYCEKHFIPCDDEEEEMG